MSRVSTGALLAMLTATSAFALSAEIDTDGDGMASLTEIQAFYPEVTEELFGEMDTDGDGYVNDEEFLVAVGAELIPDPEADL
ncbi:EF-hand domain-containing protein [Roseovarius rhodophyticola]|uniref:EF-hand domain-containing protein n=1 Tax=Roseovarius rhodophyticola TaxID=3080827 RepID=A0ABZ2TEM7_9RHOB|nr:EF-hand domain-containing protein [Roseovarius sp. W115]MDV2928427.1 EF-hand domain-containing protein [Roseovarius sp. W115]